MPRPAPGGRPPAPPARPPHGPVRGPAPRKKNGAVVPLVILGVIVALIAGFVVYRFTLGGDKPEDAVRRYFEQSINGHNFRETVVEGPSSMAEAVDAQGAKKPRLIAAKKLSDTEVDVTFEDALGRRSAVFPVKYDDGRYKVVGGVGKVTVEGIPAGVQVGFSTLYPKSGTATFTLLPGTYRLAPQTRSGLDEQHNEGFTLTEPEFSITVGEVKTIRPTFALTPQGKSHFEKSALASLDDCLRRSGAGCPNIQRIPDTKLQMVSNPAPEVTIEQGQSIVDTCAKVQASVVATAYAQGQSFTAPPVPFTGTVCGDSTRRELKLRWR